MLLENLWLIGFGMKAPPQSLLKRHGKILALVYGSALTLFWCGDEGMFVFFRRKKMKLFGCLSIWCDARNRGMLVLVLLMAIQRWQSEVYWTHVPDPPMLHPTIWSQYMI